MGAEVIPRIKHGNIFSNSNYCKQNETKTQKKSAKTTGKTGAWVLKFHFP